MLARPKNLTSIFFFFKKELIKGFLKDEIQVEVWNMEKCCGISGSSLSLFRFCVTRKKLRISQRALL